MSTFETRSFDLPKEQAAYIDELAETGAYATSNEVVHAGLLALRERDDAIETWLVDDVMPVAVEMRRNPGCAIPANQVFDEIKQLHLDRVRATGRDL